MGLTVRPKKGGLGTCSLSWGRLEVREVKGCADGVVSKKCYTLGRSGLDVTEKDAKESEGI